MAHLHIIFNIKKKKKLFIKQQTLTKQRRDRQTLSNPLNKFYAFVSLFIDDC